ncbi:retrovirus-related pol polyprotein from transposon TNT 1-94 [Tanacetum coccineum]
MKEVFEQMEAEVDQHAIDKKCDEIERKNLLIENENLIADCLSKDVFYTATDSVLTVSRFSDMHDAFAAAQKRIAELESENSNLKNKIQNDDHDVMIKHFSRLEVEHLNLQLEYQHLKERFGNKKSMTSSDAPTFGSVFVIGQLKEQALDSQNKDLNAKVNALHDLNERFWVENEKVKHHYKELYDSIKITRAKTIEKTNSLLNEIENLKAHIKGKSKCVTMPAEKPKVLAPDRSLASAFIYTKQSQELVEYVIGTCPKDFNKQDKRFATTPLTRNTQVTFAEKCETSNNNTQKHVEQQNLQITNVPVIPSPGVNSCTDASGSKPRNHTKKNRISLAKRVNKKKVEEQPRTNKSSLKKTNRVDSSISSKRAVINSNSHSVCKTCNKCLTSANHDMCVINYLNSVNASPFVNNVKSKIKKVWKPKQIKQVWKATGKLLTNVGYQWKPTERKFTLGDQCPLTRPTNKPLTSSQRRTKQYKAIPPRIPTPNANQAIDASMPFAAASAKKQDPNKNWGSNFPNSPSSNFMKKFIGTVTFGNDHFGAIMGYGDYVIGDSVISRVYYVEGLGHSLFSFGQFCDSDLEVAFRKHLCYVRDTDGVDLIKGTDIKEMDKIKAKTDKHEHGNGMSAQEPGVSSKVPRTPQQKGVVERRNRTLVEAARTMLIFSKVLMFLWAEAVAIAFFGALCYHTNDSEDLGKLQPTADIGIFVGYAPNRKGYRIYNKRTRRIMETIHVQFDELSKPMVPVQPGTGPVPSLLTPGQISSGLVPNPVSTAPYVPPTNKELEILFQPMFDEYLEPPRVERPVTPTTAVQVPVISAGTPSSTTIDQEAPSTSHSLSSSESQPPISHQGVAAGSNIIEDNPFTSADNDPFINVFTPEPSSEASSSGDVSSAESIHVSQPYHHLGK